ncbi:tRNA pseudouridine(38-40) synthase TruA [Salinisphaera sp. Q1T1-3]|uniref:tRNA pseudouridine(38-40) synthase TruA n=1 Tax=Salinisphaera sp. Q1T1-3 TaxID=2321229 RepID=UPI000E7109EE|nr:tRNA pseudouridine(38-40) synthase TruA [Salinisphaera sp. Q1T1-3]RJS95025.1 tRNA pseudouridine(38-40) synthase TruA [Salinisphaera sp. Q1T1-3]
MRWAACIEYDGSGYHGWQSQPHAASVQDTLEAALSRVANEPIRVVCSGRTDTGVHAQGQIVHFDTAAVRRDRSWLLGTNRYLPDDIAPQWFVPVSDDFHARFQAVAREYRYWIMDRDAPSALWRNRVWHVHHRLDHEAMHIAAQSLLGRQDFSAFRAAGCQAKSPVRDVRAISVVRHGDWIRLDIRANAFLHHMVRNIVGTLAVIGRGEASTDWVAALLRGGDRKQAGMTAPAAGLSLRRVHYPEPVALPEPAIDDAGW